MLQPGPGNKGKKLGQLWTKPEIACETAYQLACVFCEARECLYLLFPHCQLHKYQMLSSTELCMTRCMSNDVVPTLPLLP